MLPRNQGIDGILLIGAGLLLVGLAGGDVQIAFQRGLRLAGLLQTGVYRTQRQPAVGVVGAAARQLFELCLRFAQAVRINQRAGITQLHARLGGGRLQVMLEQSFSRCFGLRRARVGHQLQRQQGRPLRRRARLRVAARAQRGGAQGTVGVASLQAHPANAGPRNGRQPGRFERVRQRQLDRALG
ncbi:MAG: hypothetical protein LBH10_07245 [Burkholderiaceae bacterium]|nr:hypothetical protein [Burkholderiaceae bacterium]